jgi:transcriptional regulator with XRE-family HTH domain
MVQQQLGEAVGIEGKGATNRIAQYECDYRIPQNDILIDMAKSMNITYYSS